MKKRLLLAVFMLISFAATNLGALSSYYGLNGLYFLPLARTGNTGENNLAISSLSGTESSLSLFPYSFHTSLTIIKGIEVGLTNTYLFYNQANDPNAFSSLPDGGYVAGKANLVVPIIPSIKLAFLDQAVPNGSLGLGFEYPYGVFANFDYLLKVFTDFSLYFMVGLSTTVNSLYGFGGLRLSLPLSLALTLEGAYGGKTVLLTAPQEAFISAGIAYAISSSVAVDFIYRLDLDGVRRLAFGFNVNY